MSGKRRANVSAEYLVDDSSSEEEANENFEVSSSGRHESVISCGSSDPRRRGRGTSKRPCLNRNALMARENRQRKKEHLEKIETKLSFYRQENKNLTNAIQRQDIDLKRLRAEVSYLKNVLNNSSSITTLLKSMNDTLSVKKSPNPRSVGKTENHEKIVDSSRNQNWSTENLRRRGGKYSDRSSSGASRNYGFSSVKNRPRSLADSDHTYTTSNGSLDEKMLSCADSDDNERDSATLAELIGQPTTLDGGASPLGFSERDFDDLPQFDANLFESLSNDRDETIDCFRGDTDNLFESLENTGICLHVNSGKISLEFCSICHLNSVNSSE